MEASIPVDDFVKSHEILKFRRDASTHHASTRSVQPPRQGVGSSACQPSVLEDKVDTPDGSDDEDCEEQVYTEGAKHADSRKRKTRSFPRQKDDKKPKKWGDRAVTAWMYHSFMEKTRLVYKGQAIPPPPRASSHTPRADWLQDLGGEVALRGMRRTGVLGQQSQALCQSEAYPR